MKLLKLIPDNTHIPFVRVRGFAFAFSGFMILAAITLFFVRGLNYGIDFQGGILIEAKTEQAVQIGSMRSGLNSLGLGDVQIQQFGQPNDVLIRVQRQEGDAAAQEAAVEQVKAKLGKIVPGAVDYRRVEFVGPKVSGELVEDGILSVTLAIFAVLLYIWVRFEWQFGVGAVIALFHDVLITIGMFAFTQLQFDLSTIAALLTIVGYSLNDTVVVYDRIRENLLKFRKMPIKELLDVSINDTLSRTTMTSFTTLLALFGLFFFGGEVIRGFTAAMIWGIFIGTYSSIFVASPILLLFNPRDQGGERASEAEAESA